MKRCLLLLLVLLLLPLPSLAEEAATRTLVVYFSRAGENYAVGQIEVGNTARMAALLAEHLGADLFELMPEVPYPTTYSECLDVATQEITEDARPAYVGDVADWAAYDTVCIGYPIWWGGLPKIIYTFVEAHDFTGKTVLPFNTHEGSGQGRTQQELETLLPGKVLQGLAVRGSRAQSDPEATLQDITQWLNGLHIPQAD